MNDTEEQPTSSSNAREQIRALEEEVKEYKDKYLRLLAEIENTRKRMQKEKQEMTRFAMENASCRTASADRQLWKTRSSLPRRCRKRCAIGRWISDDPRDNLKSLAANDVHPFRFRRHRYSIPTGTKLSKPKRQTKTLKGPSSKSLSKDIEAAIAPSGPPCQGR